MSWTFTLKIKIHLLVHLVGLAFSLIRVLLIRSSCELEVLLLGALQITLILVLLESLEVYVKILGGLLDFSHSTLK